MRELTLAERTAIRAALNAIAWELDVSKNLKEVPPVTEVDWRFRTRNQEDITLDSQQLRELATLFQEENDD